MRNGGPYDRASDAVVAFGPNNVVFYSSLVFNDGSGESGDALRSAIVNSTSTDGGKTWGKPTVVIDDSAGGLNDKNWEVVDNGTGTGHHTGRLYVVWDRVAPMLVSYSDDQGKTFSTPSVIYAGPGDRRDPAGAGRRHPRRCLQHRRLAGPDSAHRSRWRSWPSRSPASRSS